MYVLRDLWLGTINPTERFVRSDSEYQRLADRLETAANALLAELSPEGQKQLETFTDLSLSMSAISEEDVFITGFRLGVRTIMDVMGDYRGQFYSPSESPQA